MAPEFTLESVDGPRVSLVSLRGALVLLHFCATTHDPCLSDMPRLVHLHERHLKVLSIFIDGPETTAKVPRVIERHNIVFPVLLDTDVAVMDAYAPKGILPTTMLVDARGRIAMKLEGYAALEDAPGWRRLDEAITLALEE